MEGERWRDKVIFKESNEKKDSCDEKTTIFLERDGGDKYQFPLRRILVCSAMSVTEALESSVVAKERRKSSI